MKKQQGFDITTTDYVGTRLYENGSLKRLLIDGGYIEGGNYYFYLTDHLGSTRVVARADGTIMQTNHYYPYGLTFAEGIEDSNQRYKFNGKELDTDLGLNYYDFGARLQDPVLGGRSGTRDPMARKYYPISPYAYCAGNPVKFVDPTGMEIWIYYRDEDENEQRLHYTANMEYNGTNSFVANVVGNLNAVYGNGGDTMLDVLVGSENEFNFMDQQPSVGSGAFRANENGGGTIFAGNLGSVDFNNVEMTAHELFHGLQHEY